MIRIIIPGEPNVLNRPRFTSHGGFTRTYDSQKQIKNEVILKIKYNHVFPTSEAPLLISLEFRLSPAISDKNRNLKLWGLDSKSCKDLDNMIKFYLDCIPYEQLSPEMKEANDKASQMQTPWFVGSYIMDYAKEEILDFCRGYAYLENGKIFNDKDL